MPIYGSELVRVSTFWQTDYAGWTGEQAITTFWLNHIHHTGEVFDWTSAIQTIANGVAAKYQSHWSALNFMHPTHASIVGVKAVHIDTSGHALNEAVDDGTHLPLAGTATDGMLPPEVAVCLSEWGYEPGSFTTLKGRKRGRFYIPYIAKSACDTDGRLTSAAVGNFVDGYQAFLNDVQGMHVSGGIEPDYMALVAASGIDGSTKQIGWISVDNHFDSQRRRQHQTPATRQVDTISF